MRSSVRLSDQNGPYPQGLHRGLPRRSGRTNAEIYGELLGFSEQRIASLKDREII